MDHDLLLDLTHLDDPDPPGLGLPGAEEAARLAARNQRHRARMVAGAVLTVAILAGIGMLGMRDGSRPAAQLDAALAPPSTDTDPSSTTNPPAAAEPGTSAPPGSVASPGTARSAVPGIPPGTTPGTPVSPEPVSSVPVRPDAQATGQPPPGTSPAPAGLRFTLTLGANPVPIGGSVAGVVRLENNRTTSVTLTGGGCWIWHADLYEGGGPADSSPRVTCPMAFRKVIAPGAVEQGQVEVRAEPTLRPGAYDAFTTIGIEEDRMTIHTERVVVNVVPP